MGLVETEWLLVHSEATSANPGFVWKYMTEVTNWSDPPASFSLDAPFEAGSHGMTVLPDREPYRWTIEDVQPGTSYTIGSELDEATLLCQWRFDPEPNDGTRLTQRIGVTGRAAPRHAEAVRSGFEPTLAAGMKRIALLLSEAQSREVHGAAQQRVEADEAEPE